MKYIVHISGGLTSFWAAKIAVEQKGKANVEGVFANTKGAKDKDNPHAGEDQDSYRFIKDIAKHLGIRIWSVSDRRNIWDVMHDVRAIKIPQQDYAPCSKHLKQEILDRFIAYQYAGQEITQVFGMNWDEKHRIYRLMQAKQTPLWFPLVNPPYIEKEEIAQYLIKHNIAIPRMYLIGFQHNNCGGFCVRAGKAHFARLYAMMPDRYKYHEAKEAELQAYLGKPVTVLKETINGKAQPLSLREFRERLENGTAKYDPHDYGACGCFVSGLTDKDT